MHDAWFEHSDDVLKEALALIDRLKRVGPRGFDRCDVLQERYEVYAIPLFNYPNQVLCCVFDAQEEQFILLDLGAYRDPCAHAVADARRALHLEAP